MTKKNLFVLRVDDYRPDLCKYTIPTIKAYAEKIGANYIEISKRWFPKHPVTFEKLQVYHLGADADWNILVDADFMLHPDLPDFTLTTPKNTVATHYKFRASNMFEPNAYFERDGRDIGIAGGFVITSNLTHDLWEITDEPVDKLLAKTRRKFIVDELVLSTNLAKYGLKLTGVESSPYIAQMMVHIGNEEKTTSERIADVDRAKALATTWGLLDGEASSGDVMCW